MGVVIFGGVDLIGGDFRILGDAGVDGGVTPLAVWVSFFFNDINSFLLPQTLHDPDWRNLP